MSKGHWEGVKWVLNQFCKFCGDIPVSELKKAHVKTWIESKEK
jgi:hypothetical protein